MCLCIVWKKSFKCPWINEKLVEISTLSAKGTVTFIVYFWFRKYSFNLDTFLKSPVYYNTHTHTHTHIYMYIYMCTYVCTYVFQEPTGN